MKYPNKLKQNGTIGVVAPSAGFVEDKFVKMCENSKMKIENLGYKIKYSDSCFNDLNGRSNTKLIRSNEFLDMYLSDDTDIIISLSGGEFEMEILDNLDLEILKKSPEKLFCGCSDNTILTFLLTTYCDIATVYGHNFYELGINHLVIDEYIDFLEDKNYISKEIKLVSEKDESWKSDLPEIKYNCDYHNDWKLFYKEKEVEVSAMMIGGLLDDLICLCGTKYDKVSDFVEKYKSNGFIWYFDICTLTQEEIKRALWQLKNARWFKYAKMIVFGRPINQDESYGVDYRNNMYDELKELDIPVIFDINIGHIPPSYHIYNGAIAKVSFKDNNGMIEYI